MIIKLKKTEYLDGETTIGGEVKKRLNGETPGILTCETTVDGETVIVAVKL